MQTISLPIKEYENMTRELELLKNSDLLKNLNQLIDLMYAEKYGLYLNDYTEDLTEYSINSNWKNDSSDWDAV